MKFDLPLYSYTYTGGMPNFDEQAESDGEGVHSVQGSV